MVLVCVEKLEKSQKDSRRQGFRILFSVVLQGGKTYGKLFRFVEKNLCAGSLWKFLKRCDVEKEKMCKKMWKRETCVGNRIEREIVDAKICNANAEQISLF